MIAHSPFTLQVTLEGRALAGCGGRGQRSFPVLFARSKMFMFSLVLIFMGTRLTRYFLFVIVFENISPVSDTVKEMKVCFI